MENTTPKPERKKVMLSGIQPTGVFTLGNYIGAVRNWGKFTGRIQLYLFLLRICMPLLYGRTLLN